MQLLARSAFNIIFAESTLRPPSICMYLIRDAICIAHVRFIFVKNVLFAITRHNKTTYLQHI